MSHAHAQDEPLHGRQCLAVRDDQPARQDKVLSDASGRGAKHDVEWEPGTADVGVPWLKPRRGRAEVPGFFEALSALDIRKFQPKTLLERDNVVVAIIGLEFVVKSTAHTVQEEDEVHIWRFDDQGRVASFCHKVDSHQHWLALQPT